MSLNHPEIIPHPSWWKNCLLQDQPLMPERLGTSRLDNTHNADRACSRAVRWGVMPAF